MQNGLSALHKAAKWGHTNVVKQLLLSKRFDVNEQDKVSTLVPHTPRTHAASCGPYEYSSYAIVLQYIHHRVYPFRSMGGPRYTGQVGTATFPLYIPSLDTAGALSTS